MIFEDEKTQNDLIKRMRRIEGQARGVQSMIESGRECGEILQQLAAIRSAVQSTSLVLLKEYAAYCLIDMEREESHLKRGQLLENLITILGKAP